MNAVVVQLAIVGMLVPGALTAGGLRLCVEDQARVSVAARAELILELTRLFPGVSLADDSDCEKDQRAIRIALAKDAVGRPPDVLGAIQVEPSGRVAPPALVFVDAVAAYSGASGEGALGRALARVAGHEVLHYLQQSSEHASDGLMQHKLSALDLTGHQAPSHWSMVARAHR